MPITRALVALVLSLVLSLAAPAVAEAEPDAGPNSPCTEALPKYADAPAATLAFTAPSLMLTEPLTEASAPMALTS